MRFDCAYGFAQCENLFNGCQLEVPREAMMVGKENLP
jgi:hypothetical protein